MKNKNLSTKQKVTPKPKVNLRQLSDEELSLVIGGVRAFDPEWVPL